MKKNKAKRKQAKSKAKQARRITEKMQARHKREDAVIHLVIDDKYTLRSYPAASVAKVDSMISRIVEKMKKHNRLVSQDKFKSALPVERNCDRLIGKLNAFLEKTDKKALADKRAGQEVKTKPSKWMNARELWNACEPAPKAKAVKKAKRKATKAPKKATKARRKAKAKAPKAKRTPKAPSKAKSVLASIAKPLKAIQGGKNGEPKAKAA